MTQELVTPVILCGGSGTRLWPRSRPATPKPFLSLIGGRTLFQEALQRCTNKRLFGAAVVVSAAAQLPIVEAQASEFDLAEIIVEPEARQTAAAIALAALRLPGDAVMIVCPSDHHIEDTAAFSRAAASAAELARHGWLVCLAVLPSAPDTGFGYVRRGEPLGREGFRVSGFVEKPDKDIAAQYVASGEFAWNAGIFAFRARDYLRELKQLRPALADAVSRSVGDGKEVAGYFRPDSAAFGEIEPESVDYAVMENTTRAAMVMAKMGWSDVGSWSAVHAVSDQDGCGNSIRGAAQLLDCRNVLVDSDGPRVHVIGVEELVVVVDGDDILVASKEGASRVADLSKS